MNEASPNPLSGTGTPPPHQVPPPLNVDGRWTIGVYPTPEAEPEVVYSDALKEAAEDFMRRVFTQYPAELTLSEVPHWRTLSCDSGGDADSRGLAVGERRMNGLLNNEPVHNWRSHIARTQA